MKTLHSFSIACMANLVRGLVVAKHFLLFLFCISLVPAILFHTAVAEATAIRVYQESSPNADDFESNYLGNIRAFETTASVSEFYQYDNPLSLPFGFNSSYNGIIGGEGPETIVDGSQVFFVEASDGLSLVVVHDAPSRSTDQTVGGTAQTWWEVFGDDMVDFQVKDDPDAEETEYWDEPNGADPQRLWADQIWFICCTDGYAFGTLDGRWSALGQFFSDSTHPTPYTGLTSWQATSAAGNDISLVLEANRRVLFEPVPVPPAVWLFGSGFLGMIGIARRKKAA
jgi:hypothetical protein